MFTGFICPCLDCPSNKFGFNCSMTCNCMNEGQCDKVRGCVCVNGWTGGDCNVGEYEVDHQCCGIGRHEVDHQCCNVGIYTYCRC